MDDIAFWYFAANLVYKPQNRNPIGKTNRVFSKTPMMTLEP